MGEQPRVWNDIAVVADVIFRRGDLPASWTVFLAESDHNVWDAPRIWDAGYGRAVVDTLDEWRRLTPFGEGSLAGDPGLDVEWQLLPGSRARGIGRGGVDPGARAEGGRIGPSW